MKQQLEEIRQTATQAIDRCTELKELDAARVQYLGKKGQLTSILKQMGKLSAEERPVIGQLANEVRQAIDQKLTEKTAQLKEKILNEKLAAETIDVTMPPIRVIAPGRVYRSDAVDATHSPLFYQIEGLVVDKGITMAHLKGTLEMFAKRLYGEDTRIRLRPHHFPFTEPSCEIDVSCFKCGGKGCPMCKGEGWIEILGGGMVHPKVLKNGGVDPEQYSGFAFGVGLERLTMFKYNIDDMRLLYENDLRFLGQF